MADDGGDILMKMVPANGGKLTGESQADLGSGDMLLTGFLSGQFFEVQDFDFGISLRDREVWRSGSKKPPKSGPGGPFAAWRSVPKAQLADVRYPLDVDPVSFKRLLDSGSPTLFDCCSNRRSFSSAAVVKRKSIGQKKVPQAFLRMDFTEVLLVGLEWDTSDMVHEACKFIYRGVKIQYRPELNPGVLGPPMQVRWDHTMALAADED